MHAVVLSESWGAYDYAEMDDGDEIKPDKPMAAFEKACVAAEELGKGVCRDQAVFTALLPELVRGKAGRLFPFGKGLALASVDHRSIWDQLTQAVAKTEEGKRNVDALVGFLNGLSTIDQPLCETLLEEALSHETLGALFPALQSSVFISAAGVGRLKRAVTLGRARAGAFPFLAWRSEVSEDDLRTLVLLIAKREHG